MKVVPVVVEDEVDGPTPTEEHIGPEKLGHQETAPHRDERQIKLDTERSFVLYPVGELSHIPLTTSTS